jgi:hypothetical protein
MAQAVSAVAEISSQQIGEEKGAKVPDVGIVVDSRPTDVHPDIRGIDGAKLFNAPGESVMEL